jgi:hypothetical protein
MNWNERYSMDRRDFEKAWGNSLPSDPTFHSDGDTVKIGDQRYPLIESYSAELDTPSVGGKVHLPNGHQVSITWAPGTYSEQETPFPRKAEIAHINTNGEFVKHPEFDGDEIGAYMSPNEVNKIIDRIKAL